MTDGDGLTPAQRRQIAQALKTFADNFQKIREASDALRGQRALLGQAAETISQAASAKRLVEESLIRNSAEILRGYQHLFDQQAAFEKVAARSAAAALEAFNHSYRATLSNYLQLARASSSLLPPNWIGHVTGLPDSLETLLLDEGLPLAYVPTGPMVRQLFDAESAAARRRILGRNWKKILLQCSEEVGGFTDPVADAHGAYAQAAIDAVLCGNSPAGQALAANLLDTVIRQTFDGTSRQAIVGQKRKIDLDRYHPTAAIVLGGVWGSFAEYWADRGDAVPRRYSRHASAHAVGPRQYSRVNAVLAIMHVTALLRLLDSGLEFEL